MRLVSECFQFPSVDLITVGTLGPKGQRVFYFQCRYDDMLVSFKMEKQQAAALAEYLDRLLTDLGLPDDDDSKLDMDLREPVVEEWVVGSMGIAYDANSDIVVLVLEEVSNDDEIEDDDDLEDPGELHLWLTRHQVAALVERTRMVVAAGRTPCPWCGRPLEPTNGDWCPCHN